MNTPVARAFKVRDILLIATMFILGGQWIVLQHLGIAFHAPWSAILPGIAVFAAAFVLSWGAELAQFEIPRALAIAFLALVAVLPEYAVDMYFAWQAGKDPAYVHFATANMTGANRLLIGVGWAAVVFTSFFRSKKGEIALNPGNRTEIFALLIATLYSFIIPLKGTLSWVDSIFLITIFAWYMRSVMRSHSEEPEIEGPIEAIASWGRGPRILATIVFFAFSGYAIFVAAEPFAEGILEVGRRFGIEEFILVQWLAPIASEAPEFIVAIIFALRLQGATSMSALISSKVNQWTLLIGMLPLVYNLSAGHLNPMVMDTRQVEEIFLTAAQSLFAIVVIANLRFSITEALLLFVTFGTQIFFTSTEARTIYGFLYLALSAGWLIVVRDNWRGLKTVVGEGFRISRR